MKFYHSFTEKPPVASYFLKIKDYDLYMPTDSFWNLAPIISLPSDHTILTLDIFPRTISASWVIIEYTKHDFTQRLFKGCSFCLKCSSPKCLHVLVLIVLSSYCQLIRRHFPDIKQYPALEIPLPFVYSIYLHNSHHRLPYYAFIFWVCLLMIYPVC